MTTPNLTMPLLLTDDVRGRAQQALSPLAIAGLRALRECVPQKLNERWAEEGCPGCYGAVVAGKCDCRNQPVDPTLGSCEKCSGYGGELVAESLGREAARFVASAGNHWCELLEALDIAQRDRTNLIAKLDQAEKEIRQIQVWETKWRERAWAAEDTLRQRIVEGAAQS